MVLKSPMLKTLYGHLTLPHTRETRTSKLTELQHVRLQTWRFTICHHIIFRFPYQTGCTIQNKSTATRYHGKRSQPQLNPGLTQYLLTYKRSDILLEVTNQLNWQHPKSHISQRSTRWLTRQRWRHLNPHSWSTLTKHQPPLQLR
jgi:hypothetical protein